MPEGHDTDFRWEEYVDKVNNELISTYGNFIHRVMTLTHRIESPDGINPLAKYLNLGNHDEAELKISKFDPKVKKTMKLGLV